MPNLPLATIPATEVRTILSSVIGQEYLISVALPFHYAEHTEKTSPVIYVLDANLFFGMVTEMVRVMNGQRNLSRRISLFKIQLPQAAQTVLCNSSNKS